ncbi:segregation and condensation protein A [Paenibacillus turpanensis]|uniref:segregation and condensation protein A n=1 Tax=Paenibacillus turpanensis TaxID=2689078 RepID=UPI00140D59C9|nr:segregation/condensation protein A [Paenibacillus turpanensis]
MSVSYKLNTFEGPLDLLLHLIDKAEVDIYDIPISDITDQYFAFMDTMHELQLELASEFVLMASTLLAIKSKMLLPKPPVIELDYEYEEDLEDPRAELVQKLIEYRKYKGIADHLRERELDRSLIYSKEPEDLSPFVVEVQENPLLGLQPFDLLLAFQKVLRKSQRRDRVAHIRRDEISVKDRMKQVLSALVSQGGRMLFSRMFSEDMTREDIVVSFLALLELMKMKKISCFQHRLFEDIVITASGEGGAVDDGLPGDEIRY